ncbi:MAG TPA: PilC/PilY family type IV pilus protein [Frateuria sp.]|uniref:pilus assembly protein n=1 Tax=Frateuria sp. TaxID=2211372 RepID=UPI002DE6CF1E|nr:PilC/PilY family type IV pilus protein [Frateuria sp.]
MRSATGTRERLATGLGSLVLGLCVGFSATAMAGTVDLSAKPPEATTTVAPNLVLTFDDSGSMNWHHSPDQRPYIDNKWWTTSTTDQSQTVAANRTFSSSGAPFLCAGVITAGITDTNDPRSWSMNGVYFNPDNTYDPPLKADGSPMPQSSYTAAWDNGIEINRPNSPAGVVTSGNSANTRSLASVSFCGNNGAGYYKYTRAASTLPVGADGQLTSAAVGNLYANKSGDWVWVSLTSSQDQQNFANWYSYYRTRTMAAVTSISRAFAPFNKNVRVAWQNINSNQLSNSTKIYKFVDNSTTSNVRTGFYNWLFNMTANGGTPNRSAAMRVGTYFTNRTGATDNNPYWDRDVGKELICRQNFHVQMTDGMWNSDTPSALSINDRTSTTLPDGRSFSISDAESKAVWNEATNSVVTMADIAFYYWSQDLQAGVTGTSLFATTANRRKVSPSIVDTSTGLFGKPLAANSDPRDNKEIYWNPTNDPATWPHLVQYMIGFGASGTLANNDATYTSLRKGATAWPVPVVGADDGKKIDDMWHAALNSRGQFFAASNPADLVSALTKIISSIVARSTTSVAGSLSTSVLSTAAMTYKAGYDTNDWSGSVAAYGVKADGTVGGMLWSGGDLLDARAKGTDSRVILTSTAAGVGKGAAFTGATVVNAINGVDPAFGTSTAGADRLAWLRGNQSKEGISFRQRNHMLGAVMNAQVLYVAQPASGYRDSWPLSSKEAAAAQANKGYAKFQQDHAKRAPTIYVGANDGMLHAFDATRASTDPGTVDVTPSPGAERWAYVPYSVYGRLAGWSSLNNFSFQPSVDGTPVSRDVFFGLNGKSEWHTLLVGGLRYGGRGVYALDITDAPASQSTPDSKVLWEFNNTSTGGANLGYTYGRPNIGRLASGQWVVLVPGGYFPNEESVDCTKSANSGNPVCNKFSSLFVLDAQTGALLKEIKTPTTASGIAGTVESYGLTTPVMGDYQGDQIEDVAFAGDLQGNIWRFDLTGDSSNWKAELFFRSSNPGDRPVTVMPRLFPDPIGGGLVVVFGTGKYLAGTDNVIDSNTKQQAVYGIRDNGQAGQAPVVEGTTPLVEQTLSETGTIRGLTNNAVPLKNAQGAAIRGWYFNLYVNNGSSQANKGERVVVDATALFDTNRAIITTLIPQDNDPCDPAPRGAVIVIDAATGGAAPGVNFGAVANWPDGYKQAGALVKNPPTGGFLPVASAVGGGQIYLPGVTLQQDGSTFSAGAPIWRRRSWRELSND